MRSPRRVTVAYVAVLLGSIAAFTLTYWWGMGTFEGDAVTLPHSLQVVVETYTTAGYGSDAPWESLEMNLFVIAMNTIGTVLIFLALPVFLTPVLRNALEREPPTTLSDPPSDHVVVASLTPRTEPLTDELREAAVEYVLVEGEEDAALEHLDAGETVLHGEPASRAALEAANLREARALVVDIDGRMDASTVLAAREVDEDVRIVSVVDEPGRTRYHELAGANGVVSTRPVLGTRLAEMATAAVRTDLGEGVPLGEDLIVELPISRSGELEGWTVEQSGLLDDERVALAGLWREGEFVHPVPPDGVLTPGTVLLVIGEQGAIADLAEHATGRPRDPASGETIVAGYGDVGQAVAATLEEWDLPYTVIDREDGPEVDVVGDATEPDVLHEAGLETADAIVLALPDDADTEFATLVARDASDAVHVAARADDEESVRRLYRAGADYVLPVAGVTGRLLAATVLLERPVLAADARIEVRPVDPGGELDGATVADARETLGEACRLVAVERDGEVWTERDDDNDDRTLEPGDGVALVGTDEALAEVAGAPV